jgi:hypothetical protein
MFRTGQKLIIIQSDVIKKTGPRRGSIGTFVCNKRVFCVKNDIHFHLGEIIFTRYGFEKNFRNERRKVIFAYPLIPFESEKDYNITRVIRNCIRTMSDNTKQNAYSALGITGTQKPPICLATPINDNVFNTTNDFLIWITSFLLNDFVNYKIDEFILTKPYKMYNCVNLINYFRNILHTRDADEAFKIIRKETPEKITCVFRTLESLIFHELYDQHLNNDLPTNEIRRNIHHGNLKTAYTMINNIILRYTFIEPYLKNKLKQIEPSPEQYEKMNPQMRNLHQRMIQLCEQNINKVKKTVSSIGQKIHWAGLKMDVKEIQKLY